MKHLRQEDGPSLVTQGSTELVHALLANNLVDAVSIFIVPVVLGGGKKLFRRRFECSAAGACHLTASLDGADRRRRPPGTRERLGEMPLTVLAAAEGRAGGMEGGHRDRETCPSDS